MKKIKIEDIRNIYLEFADDENAFLMSKYMKNKFAYFGVKKSKSEEFIKPLIKELKAYNTKELYSLVGELWDEDEREMQYVALEILTKILQKRDIDIDFIEKLILKKSWWDTVDTLSNLTGAYFKKNLEMDRLNRWVESDNIWLNRSAIIYQLKYKDSTNQEIIEDFIERLKGNKEFFIQKAIGWILRENSKRNPQWVKKVVENQNLTGLAKREALRLLK